MSTNLTDLPFGDGSNYVVVTTVSISGDTYIKFVV